MSLTEQLEMTLQHILHFLHLDVCLWFTWLVIELSYTEKSPHEYDPGTAHYMRYL